MSGMDEITWKVYTPDSVIYDAGNGALVFVTVWAQTREAAIETAREACGIPVFVPLTADRTSA